MMAPVHKVAIIQLYPKPMQIEENHAKACHFIRSAASQGCHLAVLPEYHLTNWVPEDPKFSDLCRQSPRYLSSYRSLAKELNICIVPGTIVEEKDSNLINVAHFISNDGTILSSYQKKNLWHPERPHLTSSAHEPHEAFDTPLGKAGLLICWDLAFPEAFRELIVGGAKIIIIPTFWNLSDCSEAGLRHNPLTEALFLETMLVARTFENTCAVVFANVGGPVGGKTKGAYAGLSQVAVPFKGALGKLGSEEGMSVVELDMQILEDAEENYKVREDMGREGWHYKYALTRDEKAKLICGIPVSQMELALYTGGKPEGGCTMVRSEPAFFALIEAAIGGAVAMGLLRVEAQRMAAKTMKGTACMVLDGGHPALLRDKVTALEVGGLFILEGRVGKRW